MKNLLKKEIKQEENVFKEIINRLLKRDFSGNTGLAIKNSTFQLSANLVAKAGSFLFTIIVARLLMPELFGLYSLTLSTILIFNALSELGVSETVIRFVSRELSKKTNKAKRYIFYLGKVKFLLVIISSALLLLTARYISESFYQKPIFLALVAGTLYIASLQLVGFFKSLLESANNFSSVFKREIVVQISRLILVPLSILILLKYSLGHEIGLMLIVLSLSLSFLLASIFLFFDLKKVFAKEKISSNPKDLTKEERSKVRKFLVATAALALSGIFFGNIDKVMLGRFVQPEFIGYYTAAFSIIGAVTPLIGFSSIALLPIFSRLKDKRLERGFKKSVRTIFVLSIGAFIATLLFSYIAILILYGRAYLPAVNILRIASLLLFVLPFISIYQSYFISQAKPTLLVKYLLLSTVVNIALNYGFIVYLLPYGNLAAVYGVAAATIISQIFYLGGLIIGRRRAL